MLYLNRKIGESIIINGNIELTVVEVQGKSAKIGFTFPEGVSVLRKELYDRIMQENMEAAGINGSKQTLTQNDLANALISNNKQATAKSFESNKVNINKENDLKKQKEKI